MGACQEVTKWITENILTPVERFITEAQEACEEVKRWFEEEVMQPVEQWVSTLARQCTEQSCNWWCLCCNKWLCWFVVLIVKVIVWIVVTIGKWVSYLVCKIVTTVIGIIVELVLKIIHRLVTFVVCLFTDPLQAFKNIWDLWNDIIDTVGDIFDFVASLLDDVIGILGDVGKLVEGVGRSFCIFGKALCSIFTAIFGFIKGIIDWVADIVDWVREVVIGVKDLITGLLTGNWCKIQRGLGILNVLRIITSITRIPASWFYSGPEAMMSVATLENIINEALEAVFGADAERLERSRGKARLGGAPIGVPIELIPRRLAIRSSTFLQDLHTNGTLNLHAIAGRISDCQGKFVTNQFEGEVVYTGTSTTVSQSDLDTFVSEGPESVASFTVYPIKRDLFRRYLELSKRKGFQIGLNFNWRRITELVISDAQFIPLQSDVTDGTAQRNLLTFAGRPTTGENLSEVPIFAVFGYREDSLNGLATWFRTPNPVSPSGTTFRTRFPETGFRYVAIHEVGHCFGLNHGGHDSPRFIMWKPSEGNNWGGTIAEYGFLTGEANFNEQDAIDVWNWITTTDEARDSILP
jgi:hypothetical protein